MIPIALLVATALFVLAAIVLAFAGVGALRKRRRFVGFGAATGALVFVLGAALCATVAVGLQGYRALTHEELAATVEVERTGVQRFEAHFVFPDGREARHTLVGDQLAVDARILKWQPWANVLGLHTAYALDRVSGRYLSVVQERRSPRTVFELGPPDAVDLFAWREKFAWLAPLVDAEYGSGTFKRVEDRGRYRIFVSTTGLLIRDAD